MPNQMQGHCRKVLKVSKQSTSVEKFFEALDNGTPPVLPGVIKATSYQQLTRSPQRIGTLAPRMRVLMTNASVQQTLNRQWREP